MFPPSTAGDQLAAVEERKLSGGGDGFARNKARPIHRHSSKSMNSIRNTFLVGLICTSLSLTAGENAPTPKKDMELLQGEWSMMSGTADGQPLPDEMRKEMKRVCKGDEITVTSGGQIFLKAKFSIDPSKKPKTIDYEMTDGFTKGKKQLGIYELEGDIFKSCFGAPGAERPADFTSAPGDKRTSSVWKRGKKSL